MARATDKNPTLDQFLKGITGRDRTNSVALSICTVCGKRATEFRNDLSRKEYTISGMCQACQDSVFGG